MGQQTPSDRDLISVAGMNLKTERETRFWTLQNLADKVGMTRGSICGYERDGRLASPRAIPRSRLSVRRMAEALRVDMNHLLHGDPVRKAIGANIRAAREKRDISIETLADKVGYDPAVLEDIEDGLRLLPVHMLWRIETEIGVPRGSLYGCEHLLNSQASGDAEQPMDKPASSTREKAA